MSEESGRSLIDEEGRLFGLVNIIDLLVVLLFLAVVVAGAALLFPSGGTAGETATRYVTLDLGEQPEEVAEQISAGDEWNPDGSSDSLTITDVYRYRASSGTNVTVRATIEGTTPASAESGGGAPFRFLDDPLRLGRTLTIQTGDYEAGGPVIRLDQSGEELDVRETGFVLEARLDPGTVQDIDPGDEVRVGGERVAEVTAVEAFPVTQTRQYVLIGVSARALNRSGTLQFANRPVRVGVSIPLETGEYELTGTVRDRNTSEIRTDRQQFVIQTEAPAAVATEIETGDTFTITETPVVRVAEITVYATNDTEQRRAVLGVSVLTRTEGNAVLFGDRRLRIGSSLPIETESYNVTGEIVRRGTVEESGTPVTRTATIQLDDVSPERAAAITEGLTERIQGTTTARILDKSEEPAVVILTSEDGNIFQREHPRNRDVELRVELHVRELDDGSVRFRGRQLRLGEPITLDFGTLTVRGELAGFEDR